MHADPTTAALMLGVLLASHFLADFPLQSDHQATHKHLGSWPGRRACAAHAGTHAGVQLAALLGVAAVTGIELAPIPLVLGVGLNAATHYWIDRRFTLRGLVVASEPLVGKLAFYDNGGAFHIDMAAHLALIVPAALIIAAPTVLALQLTGAVLLGLLACAIASHLARQAETRDHTPEQQDLTTVS